MWCREPEGNKIQADAISCLAKKMQPEYEIVMLVAGKAYDVSMRSCIHSHPKSSHEMASYRDDESCMIEASNESLDILVGDQIVLKQILDGLGQCIKLALGQSDQ